MSRLKKLLKWSLLTILGLAIALFAFGYWFMSLIPKADTEFDLSKTVTQSLPYLSENPLPKRGKILAVVTSTDTMGSSGKVTGYELTELSRAYYVFLANGFDVDVASPRGGNPPVIIDDEDMGVYDFAFLNDSIAQEKSNNTIALSDVDTSEYQAIYFVGGKGAMYDFPDNKDIQSIVSAYYQSGKVIGAVCHGPAALVNVTLDDGQSILKNKTVSSFTNNEELFLIPDAATIFPFLLEDKLVENGAQFREGTMYLENVIQDGNLITGQNPWSTWKLAETMILQMGYEPKERVITAEENAIQVLGSFEDSGYTAAKKLISEMAENKLQMNRTLLAMHSIVAAMQWNVTKSFQLIGLVSHAKSEIGR
ncbi:MAG: type 1 glutamine amidotransferase domain-containing protein [Cyclobacteriaceae bacterium]